MSNEDETLGIHFLQDEEDENEQTLSKEVYNPVDRWFTKSVVAQGVATSEQVHTAVALQVEMREIRGRCPRIWELMTMQKSLTTEQVDQALSSLGELSVESEGLKGFTMLGRVLVDMKYTSYEKVLGGLELQARERADGTWRLIGQILIESKTISQSQLKEALNVLERRRRAHEKKAEPEEIAVPKE